MSTGLNGNGVRRSGAISAANAGPVRRPSDHPLVDPITAFYASLLVNLLAAAYAPIQDCDEVFNYWEPTHYLNHGYGLQTWEYSPDYSIRSWLYIVIHAIIGKTGSIFSRTKTFEFYFIRSGLAFACAICQSRLFATISRTLNPRIGIIFLIAMITSPGMFHASAAYLPSSFSMYTTMLGMSAFMDWSGGPKTAQGIMWFGIGGIIGWPFATALVMPFVAEELILASLTREGIEVFRRFLDGTVRSLLVLALQVAIDTFFYHKVVVMPWRIVLYNVFAGPGRGPNIFGTEPWDFYIRNLLLNFNIWFLLAMAAAPLLALQRLIQGPTRTKATLLRSVVFILPFYPFLVLNAAMALHIVLLFIGSSDPQRLMSRIPAKVRLGFASAFVILAIDAGVLRTIGLVTAYRAPLQVYDALRQPGIAKAERTVCIGKEWYRFPSSYHLPDGMRAKFVKSDFDGLLPGEFNEAQIGFGFFSGTWLIPPGMNDQNIADPGKYFDVDHCMFLVDSYFPGSQASALEPPYVLDSKTWEELQCNSFLDTSQTSLLGRLFWVPDWDFIPNRFRRYWGRHCLLRQRSLAH